MYLKSADLSKRNQAAGVVYNDVGQCLFLLADGNLPQVGRHAEAGVLLIETLSRTTLWTANEHDGPIDNVRKHPRRHRIVIHREIPLGNVLLGIDYFVRM